MKIKNRLRTRKRKNNPKPEEGSKVETRLYFDTRGLERHYGLLEIGERAGLWKNTAGRYEIGGKKIYAKAILKDPEQYFTPEVLEAIDAQAQKEFLYGTDDD